MSDKNLGRIWSLQELLALQGGAEKWIIQGLLKRGGQMLLAGPPKSGKTLLASEIALSLSRRFSASEDRYLFDLKPNPDEGFPGLRIQRNGDKPWKVLFFSLEMREGEIADRLRQQCGATNGITADLHHCFGFPGPENSLEQDLSVVEVIQDKPGRPPKLIQGRHATAIQEIIQEIDPDVVIFDTLIQLHAVNENDNVQMKGVMRAIRKCAVVHRGRNHPPEPVAHIILHHTRKEGGHYKAPLSPEIMRGAGAVHGVADLVMLARPAKVYGTLEVNVSSRSSSIPNFHLIRDESTLTHRLWSEVDRVAARSSVSPKERVQQRIREVFLAAIRNAGTEGRRMTGTELHELAKPLLEKEGLVYKKVTDKALLTYLQPLFQRGDITFISKHKRKHPDLGSCTFVAAEPDNDIGVEIPWSDEFD